MITSPFMIVRDTREQRAYTFAAIRPDRIQQIRHARHARTRTRTPLAKMIAAAVAAAGVPVLDDSCDCVALTVPTVRGTLAQGDYAIQGMETAAAVERKSLADLFGTVGQGRARFVRELERLQSCVRHACVVVEAEWSQILCEPPARSQLSPRVVFRSVLAWQQRFPHVHWLMMPGRAAAETATYRVLERAWKEAKVNAKA